MIHQLIDIDILTPLAFLSSKRLLESYKKVSFSNIKSMRDDVFLSQRELRHDLPDQIHENLIEQFFEDNKKGFYYYVGKAVEQISEKYFKNQYIKKDLYLNWNNILTLVPPLLFSSFPSSQIVFQNSSLPIPNDSDLNYLTELKMIETHMHINGTSEMIYNWHYFLDNLDQAYLILRDSFAENSILFKQNGINDIKGFMDILKKSKSVFEYVLYKIMYVSNDYDMWKKHFSSRFIFEKTLLVRIDAKKIQNHNKSMSTIEKEHHFYTLIFDIFKNETDETKKNTYAGLLHFYTLAQSLFNSLFVQQLNQYGFSQFQRITDSKLRDMYEDRGFKDRYEQLEGANKTNLLKHLELRFAPKNSTYKTAKLYLQIVNDYEKYGKDKNKEHVPSISITSHFIKYKEQSNPKHIYMRDAKTKTELNKRVVSIMGLLSLSKPKYLPSSHESFTRFQYLNSIDAAGNELYARPEAFASSFRYIREQAKKRFDRDIKITFHAGEDFVHIISGIRYIYEAVIFLNMQNSDRIGHATALGLSPKKWREQLNNTIVMKQGEYVDNLFFVLDMLQDNQKYHNEYTYLEKIYNARCTKVYGSTYSIKNYKAFYTKKWMKKEEVHRQLTKKQNELFDKYHSIQNYKKYNQLISINIGEISDNVMSFLQNTVMALLKEKQIAIESMITSNTRISFYTNFREHHILSWLQNPNATDIVLASDDPGIFNTNLYLEYFILNQLLHVTSFDQKAIIKKLLSNGEKYYFKPHK
ncbi:MAG: hypothetical protein PHW64_00400 [Sulfuricurvum sp.]|nr:hypothetical protein [Sulfuricurvum sp.]